MSEPSPDSPAPGSEPSPTPRWLVEFAALAGVAVAVSSVLRVWGELPERVPMHFDLAGQPDAWGSRGTLLLLPVLSAVMYILLSLVQRMPGRWYSYPVTITEENRARQERLARDLILWLKAAVTGLFAHLTVGVLRTASGEARGLGAWMTPLWIGVLTGLLVVYLIRARRAR